jgi:hypothetical protein
MLSQDSKSRSTVVTAFSYVDLAEVLMIDNQRMDVQFTLVLITTTDMILRRLASLSFAETGNQPPRKI